MSSFPQGEFDRHPDVFSLEDEYVSTSHRESYSRRNQKATSSSTMIFLLSSVFIKGFFYRLWPTFLLLPVVHCHAFWIRSWPIRKHLNLSFIWDRYHVHLSMFTKAVIKGVFSRSYCCYGNLMCLKNDTSLMIGQFSWNHDRSMHQVIKSGYYKRPIKI